MTHILATIKSHDPDKPALIGDAVKYTYGDLTSQIQLRASILMNVKILGLALDNGPEWILWDLAAISAGIPCVPIPPFFSPTQRVHSLKLAGVTHVLSPTGLVDTGISSGGMIPDGTAKITFTSGTTGEPKGVCLSQSGLEHVALSLIEVLGTELADRHLSILPLSILLENVAGVYATLIAGGTIYLPSLRTIGFANPFQPNFMKLSAYMAEHKITSAILVPELLRGLMASRPKLPALKFLAVGGSKVSPLLLAAARNYGLPVYEGYGLSECGSVVALNTPTHSLQDSVGKVLSHIKLDQENGEIIIKNPAFLGYINQPHEGSFSTGDLGNIDDNGFLHIAGRKKNILITSYGRNISPEWIESILLTQPEILQAVVYGDAQPFLSALLVPSSHISNIEEAINHANSFLPDYAHIKNYKVVTPFNAADGTLTGTGRPRREEIFKKNHFIMTKENTHELLQSAG